MHYRDDDPSGTAPKTTLYETEPGMSVESAMAVSTRLISVVSPLCFARQELARFRNAAILEPMLSDISCGFHCLWFSFWLVSHVHHVLLLGNTRNKCQTCR